MKIFILQTKFLKKKAKKYFQFVRIRRPSIRLLLDIHYKSDPIKILNLRSDSLAQLVNNANIQASYSFAPAQNPTFPLCLAT